MPFVHQALTYWSAFQVPGERHGPRRLLWLTSHAVQGSRLLHPGSGHVPRVCLSISRYSQLEDAETTKAFERVRHALGSKGLPVMTYNIRIDMEERDANNHYTKRVGRLSSFIGRMEPWLIGLQEPSSGQLLHLQSGLASHWRAVGYEGNGHKDIDRADPRR